MFSKKLRELRIEKGLTQEELGSIIYVSRSAIAKWEQGKGMPCKESLRLLSEYFNIPENELLKDDDALIIIDNIEKSSNKSKLILLIVCSYIIIILTVLLCIVAFGNRYTLRENEFYTNRYLKKMGLDQIEQIEGEKGYTLSNGSTYICIIENHDVFEDYAEYVYEYLKSSKEISNLSFAKEVTKVENNLFSTNYYLFNSNWLTDHICGTYDIKNSDKIVNAYEFYYTTKVDKGRKIGDKIEAKCFRITSYVNGGTLHYADELVKDHLIKYNLLIELYTIDTDNDKYHELNAYFGEEYFDFTIKSLDNTIIDQYFDISALRYEYYSYPTFTINQKSDSNCNYLFLNIKVKFIVEDPDAIKDEEKKVVKGEKEFNVFLNESYSLLIDHNMFTFEENETRDCFVEVEYEVIKGSRIHVLKEK